MGNGRVDIMARVVLKDVTLGMSLSSQEPITMCEKCSVVLRELWQSYLENRSDGSANLFTTFSTANSLLNMLLVPFFSGSYL